MSSEFERDSFLHGFLSFRAFLHAGLAIDYSYIIKNLRASRRLLQRTTTSPKPAHIWAHRPAREFTPLPPATKCVHACWRRSCCQPRHRSCRRSSSLAQTARAAYSRWRRCGSKAVLSTSPGYRNPPAASQVAVGYALVITPPPPLQCPPSISLEPIALSHLSPSLSSSFSLSRESQSPLSLSLSLSLLT